MRSLILQIKINGNYFMLAALANLFAEHPKSQELSKWAQLIIPAPSSLWSRLRGRLDLAWYLANTLAEKENLAFCTPPNRLYWRLNKRAKVPREERRVFIATSRDKDSFEFQKKVLIVDDIVTTGYTLHQVAACYKDCDLKFLTLGDATGKVLQLP